LLDEYLQQEFDILIEKENQEEKVEINEESKYELLPSHQKILDKIHEKFNQLNSKEFKGKINEDQKFTPITEENIEILTQKIFKAFENSSSLGILENHIQEVYSESQVSLEDFKNCKAICNQIESCLRNSKSIFKTYGVATVENYGSSANTLWSIDSDIDIAVQFKKTIKIREKEEKKQETIVS